MIWYLPGNNEDTTKSISLSGWINNTEIPTNVDGKLEGSFSVTSVSSDNTSSTNTIQLKKEKQDDEKSIIKLQYNESIQAYTYDTSLVGALKEFSEITESNLVYIYVKDYLPLIKEILGNTEDKEATDYKQKVLDFINTSSFDIKIENSEAYVLDFTIAPNSEKPTKMSINFNPSDSTSIVDVIVKDFTYSNCTGNVTFSLLKDFNNDNSTSFKSTDDIGYVDLTTLPLLLKMGIKTTNRKKYEMEGTLKAKTSGLATLVIDVDINPTVRVYLNVGDSVDENNLFTIDGLIEIDYTSNVNEDKGALSTKGTRKYSNILTKYYIKDTDAYIKKDKTQYQSDGSRKNIFSSWTWTDYYVTNEDYYFCHLDQATMVSDMLYYILVFSLEQSSLYSSIENLMSENSVDMSKILDYFKYFKAIENENKFQAKMNFVVLDVYADLYYHNEEDENQYLLSRINAYTNFNIGIAKITLNLDVTNNTTISNTFNTKMISTDSTISEYDQFFKDWDSDSNTSNLKIRTDKTSEDSSVYYHKVIK